MTKRRKKQQRTPRPAPAEESVTARWSRLSKWTKTWVALVATTAITAVVPGVIPYLTDRALDLSGSAPLKIDTDFGSAERGLYLAATEPIPVEPPTPATDPRFVPAGQSRTKLVLEGRRAAGVTLLDVRVEVVERKPTRTGTIYGISAEGEAGGTELTLNLDPPAPNVGDHFAAKHINLGRGEIWVVSILNKATRQEYAWRLHLKIRYRGAEREVTVPATDQQPFRMTAFAARPEDYRMQYSWGADGVIRRTECAADRAACATMHLPRT